MAIDEGSAQMDVRVGVGNQKLEQVEEFTRYLSKMVHVKKRPYAI